MQRHKFDGVLICSDFDEFRQMVVPNTFVCGSNGTIIQDYETHERIHSSPLGSEIYSFAAENAMPAVKAVADHRTTSSETDSIASIIDWLERNRNERL